MALRQTLQVVGKAASHWRPKTVDFMLIWLKAGDKIQTGQPRHHVSPPALLNPRRCSFARAATHPHSSMSWIPVEFSLVRYSAVEGTHYFFDPHYPTAIQFLLNGNWESWDVSYVR